MTTSNKEINTLILHHFESHWGDGLAKFSMDMEKMSDQIIDFLSEKRTDINNIIITRFEGVDYEPEHSKIREYAKEHDIDIRIEEYAYSYYPDNFSEKQLKTLETVKPTRDNSDHDNILPVDDWQKELKTHNSVALAGAFEGECVQDMEDILLHVRGDFDKIDELVVGTYVDYQFVMSPEKISQKLSKAIENAEMKYEKAVSKGKEDTELEKIENDLNKVLLTDRAQVAIKFYSNVSEDLYSNVDEISDIISNILMTGKESSQYQSKMSETSKNELFSKLKGGNDIEKEELKPKSKKNRLSI
jgi:hypothetical protein